MDDLDRVRFSGPLTEHASGFGRELSRLGFTMFSARDQLRLASSLSRWLERRGSGLDSVSWPLIEEFLDWRRQSGYAQYVTPKALRPLLNYLHEAGITVAEELVVSSPADEMLARFGQYMRHERGVTEVVAIMYQDAVRPFVEARCPAESGFTTPGPADVVAFVAAEVSRVSAKTAQRHASALRALLRFWHVSGVIEYRLDDAVPTVANRRPALPRPLEPGQVAAMLASCDTTTVDGLRDLAMLTLLSRLGLRAGEVAGLLLDDIDWRQGVITVHGKGNRIDALPLPTDVGAVIADYLTRGRPATALARTVFIRFKAPHHGLTSGGVTQAVAAAARRAGLGVVYAHRLRHSAATAMRARGASLPEIGEVLRHQRLSTTAIYVAVDVEALRTLARPWPGSAS
jgi:site-specific recombinase XerD